MTRSKLLIGLTILAIASLFFALLSGSFTEGPGEVLASLSGAGDSATRDVVLKLRLPRALTAFGTGAGLALAGVMMQVLLRNPLADPYILGTSGGAAAAALIAMALGASGLLLDMWAFFGALGSTLMVFAIARSQQGWAPGRLLLTGVVVAAGWGALVSLILALSPDKNLRGMLFWLMGDFAFSTDPLPVLIVMAVATITGIVLARSLNVLATGEQQAALLGVAVGPMRSLLYFLSALLTAIAVTTAGTVGFVGLVVPHLVRLATGADHRIVVPCSALAGGSLLIISDTLARTIVSPRQLPVGAITALVGVPLFLILLRRSRAPFS
ncbi:MAG: iron ABC transporter permease [Pseudomonadota bacterium]|nr:iron ABC transporter permease [Pseudomonadota bacterium]